MTKKTRVNKRSYTRKTKKLRGGANINITKLLQNSYNSSSNIGKIKEVMKQYIASPWDAMDKKIMDESEYKTHLNDYKKIIGTNNIDKKALCQSKINSTNSRYPFQMKLCQSHSGNLFEHSQWTALQIIKWYNDKDPIVEGINIRTAIISAFFHDIGKGGDCVKTCRDTCWLDMYAEKKYNGKGDAVHPTYSTDMILGNRMFRINCNKINCGADCEINIRTLLENEFPDINIKEVALAAEMHWEFGKLNIPGKTEQEKIAIYLDNFKKSCVKCDLIPTEALLRLCMAVACADITAGSNVRLLPSVNGIVPAKEKFIGKDPWIIFGMESKYLDYRNKVLDAYNSE
jgi:hypothetical protein